MKVAYILSKFPSLYTTFILNDMINLAKGGHSVLVLSINPSYDKSVSNIVPELLHNTCYFDDFIPSPRVPLPKSFLEMIHAQRRHNPLYKPLGRFLFGTTPEHTYLKAHFPRFGWKIYAFSKIADMLRQNKVDIIHGAFGDGEATAAMLLSEMTGVPFSFETHAKDLFVNFLHAPEKTTKAKVIFTISNYNKRYLIERFGCPKDKIVVKRVPINKHYCDQVASTPKEDNLLVSVCRLHPIKGIKYAVDAVRELTKMGHDVHYVIIGDGPLRNSLEDKVRRLSIEKNIVFRGELPNEEALNIVAASTVAVLPSIIAPNGDRDGIPTSLVEAMYLRTPVVSSRVSGIPELVDDNVNGFLTEPGDVQVLANRLALLLSDRSLRTRMGERARTKALKDFDSSQNTQKLVGGWIN